MLAGQHIQRLTIEGVDSINQKLGATSREVEFRIPALRWEKIVRREEQIVSSILTPGFYYKGFVQNPLSGFRLKPSGRGMQLSGKGRASGNF